MVRQILNAHVGHIEVRRVDAGEIGFPWISCLIGSAWIVGLHVGVKSGHDLYHGKALLHAVGGQGFKVIRPAQAFAETHPPGVPEPEERSAVGIFEVAPVLRNFEDPIFVVRVLPGVGFCGQYRGDIV
jgi:hypothetical protein